MTLLAGSVIDQARDRHAAFERKRHPDKAALRFLSAYVRKLHGTLTLLDPDAVRVDVTTALPLADFSAGIALPANTRYVAGASVTYPSPTTFAPVPIEIIQSDERNARNAPLGAGWQVGGTFYLSGTADRWKSFASIAIAVVLLPVALVALADTLALPDAAELACIEQVALFLARREAQEKASAIDLTLFASAAADAERAFITDVTNNVAGRTFYTLDVDDL